MTRDNLLPELDEAIAFQSRWSNIMSLSHTSMSALTVIASGAATMTARQHRARRVTIDFPGAIHNRSRKSIRTCQLSASGTKETSVGRPGMSA